MKKRTWLFICALMGSSLMSSAEATIIETLTVSSNGSTVTSQSLLSGIEYTIRASGVYRIGVDPRNWYADTEWSQTDGGSWNNPVEDHFRGPKNLDILINGLEIDWLGTPDATITETSDFSPHTFSPTHVYQTYVTGTGSPLAFKIDDTYYHDNSGALQVEIIPEPTTLLLLGFGGLALLRKHRQGYR